MRSAGNASNAGGAHGISGAGLQILALSKHFGPLAALADVSLQLAEGERVAVIGPNGAGKSALHAA